MGNKIEKLMIRLGDVTTRINKLDDNVLPHLYELVNCFNEILFIVGDLEAEAKFVRDEAYRDRKRVEAETKLETNGTGVVKEATAEIAIQEYRKAEHEADRLYRKYRNRYQAFDHRLIDYRQKRNKLEHELALINDRQGK